MYTDFCMDCKREKNHGGDCNAKHDGKSCLFYEQDPRGRINYKNVSYMLSFDSDLSGLKKWHTAVLRNTEKTIRVYRINSLEWDKNKHGLRGIILDCEIEYFSEENGEWPTRPNLMIVK